VATKKDARLTIAYRNIFNGSQDADLVLRDIAKQTQFYFVTPPTMPDSVRSYTEGRRAVYLLTISRHLRMTEQELAALETALRGDIINEGVLDDA